MKIWFINLIKDISSEISADDLKAYMQSIPNIGSLAITRSQDCSGYAWSIRWNAGGNKMPINVLFKFSSFKILILDYKLEINFLDSIKFSSRQVTQCDNADSDRWWCFI